MSTCTTAVWAQHSTSPPLHLQQCVSGREPCHPSCISHTSHSACHPLAFFCTRPGRPSHIRVTQRPDSIAMMQHHIAGGIIHHAADSAAPNQESAAAESVLRWAGLLSCVNNCSGYHPPHCICTHELHPQELVIPSLHSETKRECAVKPCQPRLYRPSCKQNQMQCI